MIKHQNSPNEQQPQANRYDEPASECQLPIFGIDHVQVSVEFFGLFRHFFTGSLQPVGSQ